MACCVQTGGKLAEASKSHSAFSGTRNSAQNPVSGILHELWSYPKITRRSAPCWHQAFPHVGQVFWLHREVAELATDTTHRETALFCSPCAPGYGPLSLDHFFC